MKKLLIAAAFVIIPALIIAAPPVNTGDPVNSAARYRGTTTEVLVLNVATSVPLNAAKYRKALEVQNLGPNAIYCTVDGGAPLANGSHGRKITTDSVWSLDIGPLILVQCITSANQVSGAATMVTELE